MMFTNNPIKDAEEWFSREDPRPLLGHCAICSQEIRGENEDYDADDAYEFDGDYVCDDCLRTYLDKNGYHI